MWTFITLNLPQLTDTEAQLSLNNLKSHGSIDVARSYQSRRRSEGMSMVDELLHCAHVTLSNTQIHEEMPIRKNAHQVFCPNHLCSL